MAVVVWVNDGTSSLPPRCRRRTGVASSMPWSGATHEPSVRRKPEFSMAYQGETGMEPFDPPFDWVQFPQGRARFSGGVRGADEQGHETFAIDVAGTEYFGEIARAFLPNNNDYNIEVVSFGYASDDVGIPMLDACRTFTGAQIAAIHALIVQLIDAGTRFADRPHLLMEYPNARFMGEVIFRDGWALLKDEEYAS
ncbi:hypothetical protein [Lysobacter gummosus]|uniref:hypothetical protein n=1 Tax=Lysobacter gummosus TaxID=262324 RepID=UPI00362F6A64